MKKIMSLATAVLLTACAKGPDAITPMSMPANAYSGLNCDQLAAEHQRSTAALDAAVSKQQRQAATGDAVGVFLIGVPVSSLTGGDKQGSVAQHKGELIAISSAQRNNGC